MATLLCKSPHVPMLFSLVVPPFLGITFACVSMMVHYQVYLLTMKEDGFDLEQLWTEIHWNLLSTSISLPSIFSPPFLPLKPQISFLFIC